MQRDSRVGTPQAGVFARCVERHVSLQFLKNSICKTVSWGLCEC